MALTAYIASALRTISEIIIRICNEHKINTTVMKEEENLLIELKENRPDIIFIQATIIDSSKTNIVTKIKEDELFENSFIVVTATDTKWAAHAFSFGADSFLQIPFKREQVESVLRSVLKHPKRVLVVDSKMNDASSFVKGLENERLNVTLFNNGRDGLSFASTYFPDAIACNFNLQDMSGIEFCEAVKESPLTSNIPIFVLIEDDKLMNASETLDMCFHAGIHDLLLPPFDFAGNINLIASALSGSRKRRREKVLVVEDSTSIRNLISLMLKEAGYIVTSANNGEEGLMMVLKESPDIITTDYDMPVMDGWEFCMELRNRKEGENIPIIMITARDSDYDKKRAQLLGISAFLNKPFTKDELKKTVKDVLFLRAEEKSKRELLKYVSRDVIQYNGDSQHDKPQERFLTMLFSDICSFTPLCERLLPGEVVDLLNRYFDCMIEILQSNRAVIDKIIGDAIVARFVSGNREEDALNAVKSAMAMLDELTNFNKGKGEEIHIRIGINSGYVTLGSIGSKKHRLDYTMIGDNVNTAQRLESAAPRDGCLMSSSTYELIKNYVEIEECKKLTLKGKSNQIDAYLLKGVKIGN